MNLRPGDKADRLAMYASRYPYHYVVISDPDLPRGPFNDRNLGVLFSDPKEADLIQAIARVEEDILLEESQTRDPYLWSTPCRVPREPPRPLKIDFPVADGDPKATKHREGVPAWRSEIEALEGPPVPHWKGEIETKGSEPGPIRSKTEDPPEDFTTVCPVVPDIKALYNEIGYKDRPVGDRIWDRVQHNLRENTLIREELGQEKERSVEGRTHHGYLLGELQERMQIQEESLGLLRQQYQDWVNTFVTRLQLLEGIVFRSPDALKDNLVPGAAPVNQEPAAAGGSAP